MRHKADSCNRLLKYKQLMVDYAIGLAHGMILTGFISDFKTHYKREPNQEEMIEVNKVLFDRTDELREAIFNSR
jgi:hypothetical protein